ncbi:MAG: site-2 protease family protein, partial [Candidatus Sericytochromatia bacterium]
ISSKSEQKEVDVSYLSNGIMNEGKLDFNKSGKRISTEEVRGIWITKVLDGSIGSQAGFKENDIIVSINGKDFKGVRNPEGFMKSIFKENKGSAVKIDFLRDGKIQSFDVTPDSEGKIGVGIDFIKGLILKDKSFSIPENSIILEINKSPLYDTSSLMRQIIAKHKDGTPAKIIIKRKDEVLAPITVTPQESGIIGVQIQGAIKEVNRAPVSFIEPFTTSAKFITRTSVLLFDGLIKMVTGQLSSNEVGGPIMVVAKGAEIAKADYSKLFQFTILISIELVILNVLPLPAVDGGHLFLLIIEMIRGKRLKREFEEKIHYAGLIVLLGLGVFLIFKDVLTLSKIIK